MVESIELKVMPVTAPTSNLTNPETSQGEDGSRCDVQIQMTNHQEMAEIVAQNEGDYYEPFEYWKQTNYH